MNKRTEMQKIDSALSTLNKKINRKYSQEINFKTFLDQIRKNPEKHLRNVFQLFHDMFKLYVGEGENEYPNDKESINYLNYDFREMFVREADNPFFAGRIFANRLMKVIDSLVSGANQNKIYIFRGPPGSGKSIFLHNLLKKFEKYTSSEEGLNYKIVWKLNKDLLKPHDNLFDNLSAGLLKNLNAEDIKDSHSHLQLTPDGEYFEISCPSNDHPLLVIPKEHRRAFIDDFLDNKKLKYKIFTQKKYAWVFEKEACTICTSLYNSLLHRLHSTKEVLKMVYAKPVQYNRRVGAGISVYNPGDKFSKDDIHKDEIIQQKLNIMLQDSNQVKYIFSKFARTNNGIYCLMDIKSNNKKRLIELHNIISEGIHKIEDIEESVDSLFLAILNPEDQKKFENMKSFSDRIEYIDIPYLLDYKTEVEIYKNQFGKYIESHFQPRILHYFACVIISTRLNEDSKTFDEWIEDPDKYKLFCDENMMLLKMAIYAGKIPEWLNNDDLKAFTHEIRKKLIGESEDEGKKGFSGRESVKIFNEFVTRYKKENELINIEMLVDFFSDEQRGFAEDINDEFLKSLKQLYDYNIVQQIKESLFNYNKNQISRNIKNYLFAINYDPDTVEVCPFTDDKIEITVNYFLSMEDFFLKEDKSVDTKEVFRTDTQAKYSSHTLTQEIKLDDKDIEDTGLFQDLYKRYIYNLKKNVLKPFAENENFRNAILHYNTKKFHTYDQKIREDVEFLINNLINKYNYTEQGAVEILLYVIDNKIYEIFSEE